MTRGRLFRGGDEAGAPRSEEPLGEEPRAGEPVGEPPAGAPPGAEPAAADEQAADAPPRRRTLRRAGLIVLGLIAIFVVGWLGSALWFSQAPLLPEERTVPRVVALPLDDARAGLERTDLRLRVAEQRNHPTAARGVVIWQDPAPGTAVPMNSVVQLVTSSGPAAVPVPDLAGLGASEAAVVLRAAGLAVGEIDTVGAQGEANVVLGTRPSAGTPREPGATIGLIVTAGGPPAGRTLP